jgi:hypothetical protein
MPAANQINRRNVLALTATGITAALTVSAATTATTKAPSISALIEAHRSAWADLVAATGYLSDIEEAADLPPVRVQRGRLRTGVKMDGSEEWEPLYAYSEDDLNRQLDRDADVMRAIWKDNPAIANRVEQRRQRLLNEFRAKQAERDAAEAACGITAATAAREAASDAEGECLDALIGHQFHTVEDIRLAASYLKEQYQAGNVPRASLVDFVSALAGRSS